ncbi:MAG TPA: serine dehydrogenase [bacterium]|nr:serine dehydrogenase [bacterium]
MTETGGPSQSPLYHAQNAPRYDRQSLIRTYQEKCGCRLIVMADNILPYSVTLFEELVYDADPKEDLHLLLYSQGGDGETAVRLLRAAQARCKKFTVIVPDQAKSAATLIALGAHEILMGPASDLGPIDPQMQLKADGPLVAAKDIIAAVESAALAVQNAPATYPIYASLLSDVTAIIVQQARAALARTTDMLKEALESNPDRTSDAIAELQTKLRQPLIEVPQSHRAIFGAKEAHAAGLPVRAPAAGDEQWQAIWRLWTKYVALNMRVYENAGASQTFSWPSQ